MLSIHLLGNFQIFTDGELLSGIQSPRLQSLLAYLVLNCAVAIPRRQIAFLFWPDNTEKQARTNLRKAIHFLRQEIPDVGVFLASDGPALQWHASGPYTLDVAQLEKAAAAGDLEQVIRLYAGDLLPNLYDEWLLAERERVRQIYLNALSSLAQQKENEGDYAAALELVQKLLEHDPLREEIYRRVMRLHSLNGDRAAAIHAYKTCVGVLQAELAVEPSQTTQQVYLGLLEQQELPPRPSYTVASIMLVGRDAEWADLQEIWHAAASGRPQMLLVTGEAGIGKTRLIEEMQTWHARQGFSQYSSNCYIMESRTAYAPLAAWLRSREPTFLEPIWLAEVSRLAPELATRVQNLAPSNSIREAWQRRRFHEALARAMLGPDLATTLPLLLVIENLQWCDADTLEWLGYLLRYNPRARLLLIGSQRLGAPPEQPHLASLLNELRRHDLLKTVELHTLGLEESARLGRQVLGQPLDELAAQRLYAETEGNPLFIVEFARAGLVNQAACSQEIKLTEFPSAVLAAITCHMAQLSPAAQKLVQLAATVGREFTFDLLLKASGEGEEYLVGALDELLQRNVIRERGKGVYDFSHDKLRQTVYGGLSATHKRLLHQHVAEGLVMLHGKYPEPFSRQIGWHYEQASSGLEATRWLIKAGQAAVRVGAIAEAFLYLEQALNSQGKRLPVGRREIWLAVLKEAVQHAGHMLWPWRLPAPVGTPVADTLEEEFRLYEGLAWIEGFDNFARQIWEALTGLNLAERAGYTYGIVNGRGAIGLGLDQNGIFGLAESYHHSSVSLAEQEHSPDMLGTAYVYRAVHEIYLGRLEAAEKFGRLAGNAFLESGNLRMWGYAMGQGVNTALYYAGKFAQCFELSQEIIRRIGESDYPQQANWVKGIYWMARRRSGQAAPHELISIAREVIHQAEEMPDYYLSIASYTEMARTYAQMEMFGEAFDALEKAGQELQAHPMRGTPLNMLRNSRVEVFVRAVEAADPQSRTARWAETALACREALRFGKNMRVYLPEAMRWQGTYEFLKGQRKAASGWWQRSLDLAQKTGQFYDLAMTHREWGRRTGEDTHLFLAEQLFRELNVDQNRL